MTTMLPSQYLKPRSGALTGSYHTHVQTLHVSVAGQRIFSPKAFVS